MVQNLTMKKGKMENFIHILKIMNHKAEKRMKRKNIIMPNSQTKKFVWKTLSSWIYEGQSSEWPVFVQIPLDPTVILVELVQNLVIKAKL